MIKNKKINAIFIAVMLSLFIYNPTSLFAQRDSSDIKVISVGAGLGMANMEGASLQSGLAFQKNRNIYSVKVAYSYFETSQLLKGYTTPTEGAFELALYYNREIVYTERFSGSVGAGVSYLQITNRGKLLNSENVLYVYPVKKYETLIYNTAGLVLDLKMSYYIGSIFNLYLNGFGNINPHQSFGGATFGFNINIPLKWKQIN